MPVAIKTIAPGCQGREEILRKQLQNDLLCADVDLAALAQSTEGFTGSDLRELVRVASVQRAKAMVSSVKLFLQASASTAKTGTGNSSSSSSGRVGASRTQFSTLAQPSLLPNLEIAPISLADFSYALERTKKTGKTATSYEAENLVARAAEKLGMFQEAHALATEQQQAAAKATSDGGRGADKDDDSNADIIVSEEGLKAFGDFLDDNK